MSTASPVTFATPIAVDPRISARTAQRSTRIAAPLMSIGAGLLLAALTFMDPAKAESVPAAIAGGHLWATADRGLAAAGLALLTAAAVLAATALHDRESRQRLGRHALCDGGYALAVFVIGPRALSTFGDVRLAADDWAHPTAALVVVTGGLVLLGALLLGTARPRRP